jgi:hypothetical protein
MKFLPEYFPPLSLTKIQTFMSIIINNANETIKPMNHGSVAIFFETRAKFKKNSQFK